MMEVLALEFEGFFLLLENNEIPHGGTVTSCFFKEQQRSSVSLTSMKKQV